MFETSAEGMYDYDERPIMVKRSGSQIVNSRRLTSIVESVVDSVRNDTSVAQHPHNSSKLQKKYTMIRRQPATVVKCRYCMKIVKHPSKIAEHMRTHTGERPFQCEYCGQGFAQAHPLKVHIRNHRGEKPHICRWQCGKRFATASQRSTHERTHTGERIYYSCPVTSCTIKYGKKHRVKEHVRECHPDIDLDDVGLGGPPKKILISSVEQLIATVQDPEDVEEEEIWPEDGDYYYEDDAQQQQQQPPVAYFDPTTTRPRRYRQSSMNAATTEQDAAVASLTYHYDPETGLIDYYEEIVDDAHIDVDDDNSHQQQQQQHITVDVNESIDDEQKALVSQQFLQCEYIDADDIALQPTVEEEVITSEDPYVEVARLDDDEPMASAVYPSLTVSTRRSNRQTAIARGTSSHRYQRLPVSKQVTVDDNGEDDDDGHDQSAIINNTPVIADARPPRRGRRRAGIGGGIEMVETVEVDAAIVEMAAPQSSRRHPPQQQQQKAFHENRVAVRPARNLDWIIDAVARGLTVDTASPHNRRKPTMHECKFCGKIDKYPSKIKAHLRTHTGERPFVCEICGVGFAQRTAMRMHVRRHLNQKPYVCSFDDCGARFINGALLNIHETTKHMGVKKNICMKGCGRSFAQRRNKLKHEEVCTFGQDDNDDDDDDDNVMVFDDMHHHGRLPTTTTTVAVGETARVADDIDVVGEEDDDDDDGETIDKRGGTYLPNKAAVDGSGDLLLDGDQKADSLFVLSNF